MLARLPLDQTAAPPRTPAVLRPMAARPAAVTGWVGLAVSLAAIAAIGFAVPPPVRLAAVLLFACAGPGCAIVSHTRPDERITAAALAIVASLSVFAALATLLAWAGWWVPELSVSLLAGASAIGCGVGLRRLRPPGARRRPRLSVHWRRRWIRLALVDSLVLAVAADAWLLGLAGIDVAAVGQYGLLAAVPPVFFLAPVLCIGGFVAELARGGRRGGALAAYLGLLVFVVHASTPMLLALPQYSWTYKHIGVVAYFAAGGTPSSAHDIYQQWPAFFTAAAQLSGAGGVDPLRYAAWAPVVFNLLASFVLYAIARTLARDRRIAAGTVLVFQCANWIEEDYLSPQGFAFVLSLGVYLIALRWLRSEPSGPGAGRLDRLRAALTRGLDPPPVISPAARNGAIAGLLGVMAVLSAVHQLSPYLVGAGLVVLTLLGLLRPRWVAVAAVALVVLYLLPRFGTVSSAFHIFEGFNLLGNAGGTAQAWGSVGQAVSALAVRTLALAVWAAVALAAWRSRRALGRIITPLVLAIVPCGLLLAQSYGGEAIYRVYLFSVPWCALILADLVLGSVWWRRTTRARPARPRLRVATLGATAFVLTVMLAATMQGRHGQLMVDQQWPDDVAAARYLYAHAQPGATIVLATPDFPSRLTANYDQFNTTVAVGEPDLVTGAKLHGVLGIDSLPAIASFARSFNGTTAYLVISDQMQRQAQYFGYLPDGSLAALAVALDQDPQWSIFYRNAGVVIYQLH